MGKGNQWWVHQRGAASVGYASREAAERAAASLRNARVSRFYGPAGRVGDHAVSDAPPTTRGWWTALRSRIASAVRWAAIRRQARR